MGSYQVRPPPAGPPRSCGGVCGTQLVLAPDVAPEASRDDRPRPHSLHPAGEADPLCADGAHGISGWTGRPRATKDVDILVKAGRNHARAVNALRALYPELEVRSFAGVTGFFLPGETDSLIDVPYPHRADIEETLRTAIWVEDGPRRYRVPTLEAALANKYGAMFTLNRDMIKRGQDSLDFAAMVKHSTDEGRQPIDLEELRELGEKVW